VVQCGSLLFVGIDDRISDRSNRKNVIRYVICPNDGTNFTIIL
jgi:hypothetical protein